ncbi:sperm microtubule associated protein 1-like [Rhopilema esculentum]|uniref:sperm microtubule associated protein 1-like n=1 Tax=Rhopilema esculentum TaxID=499914 RepID=UPI0031D0FB96
MSSPKKTVLPRCVEFGPPEPTPEEKKRAEKGFVLDGIAVATFSHDCGHASPKLATAIPPYNAQKDLHAQSYFKGREVDRTLKKTGQYPVGSSINGKQVDFFHEHGRMGKYLKLRNDVGAGHSTNVVGGHDLFMTNVSPTNGYHGPFGFRRNTPWLRESPSSFKGKIDSRSVVP